MKTNYHTHTNLCGHATGDVLDYVEEAVSKKLDVLGMSDHAPFPLDPYHYRMSFSSIGLYLDQIDEAKKIFGKNIDIKKGFEIEYLKKYDDEGYYKKLFNEYNVDYLLLGQHYFESASQILNVYSLANTACVLDYAKDIERALKTGYFKIVAHPDIFTINFFAWDENYTKASEIIINAAIKYDVALEFNVAAFRGESVEYPDGVRFKYPHYKFWEMVAKTNAKVIVGSDAHNPKDLYDIHVVNAKYHLQSLGITPIEVI